MEPTTMGGRIAFHRKRLGLTQEQLAQALGISAQAVSKWEHDQSCPDISILPRLAGIFGITTDELLGVRPWSPVQEAEIVQEEDGEPEGIHITDDKHNVDIHWDCPRGWSLAAAAWIIAIGVMMLAGLALRVDVSFWSAAWITGLVVFGVRGMLRRIGFANVTAALCGVYFLLEELRLVQLNLGWGLVFPVLIVLFGVSLLAEGFRKKNRRHKIRVNGAPVATDSHVRMHEGVLHYSGSFDDGEYLVTTPELRGGQINVSFGDQTIDFTGVERLAENCHVRLNSSFGDVTLRVPRRYRVELEASKSFSDLHITGAPDESPEGVLRLTVSMSFGDLEIQYV